MQVRSFQLESVTVFQVDGEINITTSPDLKKAFEKEHPKKVVVDLEKVTYVDSSGLATLVEMLKKTKIQAGQFVLAAMSEKVKSLFEITKLDKLFIIIATQADAVAKIK